MLFFFIYLRVPVTAYHYEGNCIYSSILLQENKEMRAQINDMQEKQMQKLKHLKEKVIIPDQIRVNLHLWIMMFFSSVNTARLCQAAHAFLETGKLYL